MTLKAPIAALATAAVTTLAGGSALAGPAWITVGEAAYALLQPLAPQMKTLASRAVAVDVPASRGSRTLVRSSETVHAVEVDEVQLPGLTEAVHERLKRCGGFARHASQAEALAVLHRLSSPPAQPAVAVPSYAIDNVVQVQALLPQLQASNILAGIESMAAFQNRRYDSSHGVAASTALFNRWSQLNPGTRRDVKVTQLAHTGFAQKSVMFEILGSDDRGQAVILGAHLDSIAGGDPEAVRAPGADDDASGVASLTEIIRVLMANHYQPRRTLRFVAYAAEEPGLLGSQQVAASYAAQRVKPVAVLQLDMVAYQGDPTDLWIFTDFTNAAQNQFLADLAAAYLPQLTVGYDRCGYACSDHASWTALGYAASLPFESSDANYNHALHTPADTLATFGSQAEHALKFAQLSLAFAVELASDAPASVPAAARR